MRHRHAENVTETMAASRKTRRRQALTLSITSWWSLGPGGKKDARSLSLACREGPKDS